MYDMMIAVAVWLRIIVATTCVVVFMHGICRYVCFEYLFEYHLPTYLSLMYIRINPRDSMARGLSYCLGIMLGNQTTTYLCHFNVSGSSEQHRWKYIFIMLASETIRSPDYDSWQKVMGATRSVYT